jgi:hypothetical protein
VNSAYQSEGGRFSNFTLSALNTDCRFDYKKEIKIVNRAIKTISAAVMTATMLVSAVAQARPQQNASPKAARQSGGTAQVSNTPGRIAKFTGNKQVGDSNIVEDDSGKIGIGTTLPTSQLTVNGVIEMLGAGSGIKFADGTLQTTAGLATISRDGSLRGNGTPSSPLGLASSITLSSALNIFGDLPYGSVLTVTNSGNTGTALSARGGNDGGEAIHALGADNFSVTNFAGIGIRAFGGRNDIGAGADGVQIFGGQGALSGGFGARVNGGLGGNGNGGEGIRVNGGVGRNAGNRGGHGIETFAGFGANGAINGLAGKFNGDVQVTGVLSKGGGSFKIDHPLDPENKYLSHSFVESPDMMNIYNGVVSLDNNGEAIVEMPEWFGALNRDFRYLLTAVGAPMPGLYIAEEMNNNRFKISGGMAGLRVSWQVTGIRQDAWANLNRIKVEEGKSEKERGYYLHPEAFGKDEERGVNWANQPELMREMKQDRADKERRPRK